MLLAAIAAVAATASSGWLAPVPAAAAQPECAACAAQTDQSVTAFATGFLQETNYGGGFTNGYFSFNGADCAAVGVTSLPAQQCFTYGSASFQTTSLISGSINLYLSIQVSLPVVGVDRWYGCTATVPYDWAGADNGAVAGTCSVNFASGATRTDTISGRISFTWGDTPLLPLALSQEMTATMQLVTAQA